MITKILVLEIYYKMNYSLVCDIWILDVYLEVRSDLEVQ